MEKKQQVVAERNINIPSLELVDSLEKAPYATNWENAVRAFYSTSRNLEGVLLVNPLDR